MSAEPEWIIPLSKLPALCRLLGDDVSVPEHVQTSIVDSLMHWWENSNEPRVLQELQDLFDFFPESSVTAMVAEKLARLFYGPNLALSDRTLELLRRFPALADSCTPILLNTLTANSGSARWRVATALAELGFQDETILEKLRGERTERGKAAKSLGHAARLFEPREYQKLYQATRSTRTAVAKGQALEHLAEYLFLCIPGLNTIARNLRTLTEEIDIAVSNYGNGFWREIGNPFVVECKNVADPVEAATVRDFKAKLKTKGLRAGFIVTTSCLSRGAMIEMRQALGEGRVIIAIEGEHLAAIAKGEDVAGLIRDRFYACRLL